MVAEDLLDDAMDLDDGPCRRDGLGRALAGLVNDQRRALIEDPTRGRVILGSPCRQPVPCIDAPSMVALNDQRGLAPARRRLQRGDKLAKDPVDESEVVEIRAVTALGVVAVDAAPDVGTVGDGEVDEDEVGLVGMQQLEGVLLEIGLGLVAMADVERAEMAIGASGRTSSTDDLLERDVDIGREGSPCAMRPSNMSWSGPVAVLDGVARRRRSRGCTSRPRRCASRPARRRRRRSARRRWAGDRNRLRDAPTGGCGSCSGCRPRSSGQQRGKDLDGVVAGGLGVGEERALGAESVEVGEVEVGGAVLEELVVGELVEDDPDQEGMLARGLGRGRPSRRRSGWGRASMWRPRGVARCWRGRRGRVRR